MKNKKTQIIAEIAQGFEGNPIYSQLFVKAAASAGADAVKFQLVYTDELATPDYKYYDLFKSLEMSDEVWQNISNLANENNISLHLDIFGERSLKLAEKLGVEAVKIHGTDIANKRLLNKVSQTKIKQVILGAGGALQSEIIEALEILKNKEIILLFGFQSYPTPNRDNHINRIQLAKDIFSKSYPSIKIGFADHASPETNIHLGFGAMAIGLGAEVLEKHLTLAKSMKMEDHESALNPDEFMDYVNFIHECESAFGDVTLQDDFGMSESELGYRKMIRRHVVTIDAVSQGEVFSSDNLALKRTSSTQAQSDMSEVIGKMASKSISSNSPVEF
ncbi:N-acetylneuraminate synthase family protein [Aquirufa aurantiipilula]|uniref:N-acetylneuraminate synthase family protein n=1 Tax=Aquirufa aurantiipilula TaxID=2696561 RepID=A0ABT6BKV4_9BACT|nr:N-acetylneuraminate synthase family protein [Aquirufa aurantiipilula]MDF5690825.1 N-acetylneuraminate synthase family protein [Aquirufa aurantiipilula]